MYSPSCRSSIGQQRTNPGRSRLLFHAGSGRMQASLKGIALFVAGFVGVADMAGKPGDLRGFPSVSCGVPITDIMYSTFLTP